LAVNEPYRELDRRASNSRDSLVERLDPALGEASSGIGVLLSELVRRTLRGGVAKIEEEMHDFVAEHVTAAVENHMPVFQEAAGATAPAKARDVARPEVEAVERAACESAAHLAEQLSASQRQAEESARKIEEDAKATAAQLATEIADTERRVEARARELMAEQVEDLRQKSKSTYLQVRENLDELGARAMSLEAKLANEQQVRDAAFRELRELVSQLHTQNTQLENRLADLEKPRGLWGKLFSRKKKSSPETDAASAESSPDET
jgi:hypothetical protein